MPYTQRFTDDSGQTLYAVPSTVTTATWTDLKVLCTEPETGLYSVTVDETLGTEWWIYVEATVPSDWDDRIAAFGISSSTTVNVLPFTGTTPDRTQGTTIKVFIGEAASVSVALDGSDLDDLTLRFAIEGQSRTDIHVIENASITRNGSTFTVTIPSGITSKVARYKWSLRDVTGSANLVLGQGVLEIAYAASKDQ